MISLPYESSGQQIGETRIELTRTLMREHIPQAIEKCKGIRGKYYILVHAKPFPQHMNDVGFKVNGVMIPQEKKKIKQQIICGIPIKPSMMLSCMLFGVDNDKGTLTLEWAIPGDWPTWSVEGTNEPVPETIASINQSGIKYHYENFLPED
ncbi:hypothetical protein EHM76_01385 [bacterium]|nr:MAG: hypothetical protein EHM76_01385 [bacterium]